MSGPDGGWCRIPLCPRHRPTRPRGSPSTSNRWPCRRMRRSPPARLRPGQPRLRRLLQRPSRHPHPKLRFRRSRRAPPEPTPPPPEPQPPAPEPPQQVTEATPPPKLPPEPVQPPPPEPVQPPPPVQPTSEPLPIPPPPQVETKSDAVLAASPPPPRPKLPPKPDPRVVAREAAKRKALAEKREQERQARLEARATARAQTQARAAQARDAGGAAAPSAAPSSASSGADVASWRGAVVAHLNGFKPSANGAEGTARVSFAVDRGGRVVSASLAGSSGRSATRCGCGRYGAAGEPGAGSPVRSRRADQCHGSGSLSLKQLLCFFPFVYAAHSSAALNTLGRDLILTSVARHLSPTLIPRRRSRTRNRCAPTCTAEALRFRVSAFAPPGMREPVVIHAGWSKLRRSGCESQSICPLAGCYGAT